MAVISQTVSPIATFNQRWPTDCPKSLFVPMNFLVPPGADSYEFDTLLLQTRAFLENVQSCYYDNSQNNAPVILTCSQTGFTTRFAARWQGYRTLVFPQGKVQMTFTCAGGTGVFNILLSDAPFMPSEWLAA